jgi:hypothetical protein
MRAGFEYYRAFPVDAEQDKQSAMNKIITPVLVLGGYLSGCRLGFSRKLWTKFNARASSKCNGRHSSSFRAFDSRRAAEFVIDQISKFFGSRQHPWH